MPRCHLAFMFFHTYGFPHSLRNTIIFPATNVCLHVMEYSESSPLTMPSVVHLTAAYCRFSTIPCSLQAHLCRYLHFNGLCLFNFSQLYSFPLVCQVYTFQHFETQRQESFSCDIFHIRVSRHSSYASAAASYSSSSVISSSSKSSSPKSLSRKT